MNPEVLTRLLIAIAVIGSGLMTYNLINKLSLRRAVFKVRGLGDYHIGQPAILYFTTPTCTPCKTVQGPAIDVLKEQFGKTLQVFEIDATTHPDLADAWGVFSVPTTFVIDAYGEPLHINNGLATTEKLYSQLKEIF
ncbi:MAG: thioredoxin family protein [Anaerolineales bacterium]|nr:thioredoxin family protein [Anaerolineales bacterium]